MKKNSLIIILILIIFILLSYIVYDKTFIKEEVNKKEEEITLVDSLSLDYLDVYLTSDGVAYLEPLNNEEISNINGGKNLKERLTTLYDRAFYYDIYIGSNKLKAFKVKLDDDIIKIRKIEKDDNFYIIFIKENNTIGVINYEEYYNLLYTNVTDNYNNIKNVADIKDNKIIYLDGNSEEFEAK